MNTFAIITRSPLLLPRSGPQLGFLRCVRTCVHSLSVLTGSLALLASSARLFAGPVSAFPLEPAFELAADAPPEPEPLRWAGGWMLVKVMINGTDTGWFMIATGWNWSCIDPQVAARLKLFDGSGNTLWLTPAMSTPEAELIRNGRPPPSPSLLEMALGLAIDFDDAAAANAGGPAAVKALRGKARFPKPPLPTPRSATGR